MDGFSRVISYRSFLPPRVLAWVGILFLTGCSTSTNQTIETLGYVFHKENEIVLTSMQLRQLPYASAYIKVGDLPQALVVLAYANGDRLSWMSADGVMFITEHGRLVKTIGLPNDLRYLGYLDQDPLRIARLDKLPSMVWYSVAEWSQKYTSGYPLSAHYRRVGNEVLEVMDKPYTTTIIEESVTASPSEVQWNNYFWIDEHSGQVRKLKQQLGPSLPVIEMTFLKPYSS